MEPKETQALIQMCRLRYRSFSEAADSVLPILAEVVSGALILGRLEPEQGGVRIIGTVGEPVTELSAGTVFPARGEELDRQALGSLGIESVTALPLELVDGRVVGTLAALAREPDVHESGEIAMLGIAARLLSFEWESVERRAELGRLRGRLPQSSGIDPDTSLPDRGRFLEQIDHDWQLARRGTVDSVVVGFEVAAGSPPSKAIGNGGPPRGEPGKADLVALKLAAETLSSSIRATDRVARATRSTLVAGLIGCRPEQADAFISRYRAAIERIGRGSSPPVEIRCGTFELAAASSPEEALDFAIADARGTSGGEAPDRLVQLPGDTAEDR